jgi:hypothetical protein
MKVNVLDAQLKALEEPQPAAVQQGENQLHRAG